MTWGPSSALDNEVRRWMRAKDWAVNRAQYGARSRVYAWRHEVRGGPSPTLRISQSVLEYYPAWAVLYHFERLKVTAAIRASPGERLVVVVQNGSRVTLEETVG